MDLKPFDKFMEKFHMQFWKESPGEFLKESVKDCLKTCLEKCLQKPSIFLQNFSYVFLKKKIKGDLETYTSLLEDLFFLISEGSLNENSFRISCQPITLHEYLLIFLPD